MIWFFTGPVSREKRGANPVIVSGFSCPFPYQSADSNSCIMASMKAMDSVTRNCPGSFASCTSFSSISDTASSIPQVSVTCVTVLFVGSTPWLMRRQWTPGSPTRTGNTCPH